MRPAALLILLTVLLNGGCAVTPNIEGIVFDENGATRDFQVKAYRTYDDLISEQNSITAQSGERPGEFSMNLPPGRYYLSAQGHKKGVRLFAYHGLNPIVVDYHRRWLPLFMAPSPQAVCHDGFQGIGGHIFYKGAPPENGGVSVYSSDDTPFRGMGLLTNTITADGSYWFDLEPGRYVVIARKRADQSGIGPLKPGDLFCYSGANPVTLGPHQECELDIYCYPRDDIAAFLAGQADDPRGRKEKQRRALSLEGAAPSTVKGEPAALPKIAAEISGQVTDLNGHPQEDLFVTAYPADDLKLFEMYIVRFKSQFMGKTDREGRYRLQLPSGAYYLVAREHIGIAPEAGEYYGLYEGNANHAIMVRPSENREDGDITVGRVMP